MNRILILGASGFIGAALYKELSGYFDLHGTYSTPTPELQENQVMHRYHVQTDSLDDLLSRLKPTIVISSLRGDFKMQLKAHEELIAYSKENPCLIYLLSTASVFDGNMGYVAYEDDMPIAQSKYGKFKVALEKSFLNLPKDSYAIIRLPMVVGVNAPRIVQLKQAHKHRAAFEVYPNVIISAISANRVSRQLHYIINQRLTGIFHLASEDIMHHSDFFNEVSQKLGLENVNYAHNYTSNQDQYLAILPKINKLPKQFRFTLSDLINEITLKEEIVTLKENLLP